MLVFTALVFAFSVSSTNAATFTVTNASDGGSNLCLVNNCSLRQAINFAELNPGADTIVFNIAGSGVKTINLLEPLQEITQPLTIDGTTQPGYSGSPLIELNGGNHSGNGLTLSAASTIRALIINRFGGNGIEINASATIEGCYIGTNAAGTTNMGNLFDGIRINEVSDSDVVTIGGTAANTRNVISGNNETGIRISDNSSDETQVFLSGNYIGTNAAGTAAIGNADDGIYVDGGDVTIGGTTAAARNIISGNLRNGITFIDFNDKAQGNYIGTNAAGTSDLGNIANGIVANGVGFAGGYNIIGGTTSGAGNIISGNNENGILVTDFSTTIHNN